MGIQRIKINDYQALGNLFIAWALDNTKAPTDLAGFIKQVVTPGIVDPLPGYIKTFAYVQSDIAQCLIRLPPAQLVQDTLDNLAAGVPYDFPQQAFYAKRLAGQISDGDFFGFRVGDYTISFCS